VGREGGKDMLTFCVGGEEQPRAHVGLRRGGGR
jgi:hypothetical protein